MDSPEKIKERFVEDEITLKELILTIKDYFSAIIDNKKLLISFVIFGSLLAAIFNYLQPWTYPAKMTFMVEEEGKGGSAGGVLSYLGLGGGQSYNVYRTLELSKSLEISKRAFFDSLKTEKRNDFLINEIIHDYKLQEEWAAKKPELSDFKFKHNRFSDFSRNENAALKSIHILLVGNEKKEGLLQVAVNAETNIFTMIVNANSEELSIALIDAIYTALSSFYIEETIKKPSQTYQALKERADSIKAVMISLETSLAKNIDSNRRLVTKQAELQRNRLERDLKMATIEFGKLLENVGTAEFTLQNSTPVFQVIDAAIPPIFPRRTKWPKVILLGSLAGLFLGIVYVFLRKVYTDAMAEETK